MQHFRGSVIILCTKVKARDIFQQQCRSSGSSSRSTKVLHRPIQATHSYPYCANPLTALEEREIVGKLLKDGGQALTIYTVFLLSRQLRGQHRTSTSTISYSRLESRNTYYTSCTYKPYCTYCAQK